MITSLRVNRFKSWEDSGDLRCSRLTGFFGTNSSGKTSLLQLLLMLKQTAESPDRAQVLHLGDDRTMVGLGVLRDIVFAHQSDTSLGWRVAWQPPQVLRVPADPAVPGRSATEGGEVAFAATVAGDGENGQARLVEMTYQVGDRRFTYRSRGKTAKAGYDLLGPNPQGNDSPDYFRRAVGRPRGALPPPVKCYGFPDEVRAGFQNAGFLADLELAFERLLAGITYLGPLRAHPKREYTWAAARPEDMGGRGERWVDAILASRSEGKRKHWGYRTIEGHVAWWLKELGLIDRFKVKPVAEGSNLYRVWVRTSERASEVLITDVGFGVSQILPVLTLCFYAPQGSTVVLEQPEIHLHPSVQAGLADVLIDATQKRGVQIILESHSEHLLRRLQRRIAEKQLSAEDASLYFCRMENGRSHADRLQVNRFGYIENWPTGFFGDEMQDAVAMTEAAQQRRADGEQP